MKIQSANKSNRSAFPLTAFLLLFALLFFVQVRWDPCHLTKERGDSWSSSLVEVKLLEVKSSGQLKPENGWLRPANEFGLKRDARDFPEDGEINARVYRSQFGLQGFVGAILQKALGMSANGTASLLRSIVAAFTTVVVSALVAGIWRRRSMWSGIGASVILFWSVALVRYGADLYWMFWLSSIPMIGTWLIYDRFGYQKNARVAAMLVVFIACCLRSLCGYEFASALVLSACVGLAPVWATDGFSNPRRFFVHCTLLCVAGSAGVLLAMGIHMSFLAYHVGGFGEAWRLGVVSRTDQWIVQGVGFSGTDVGFHGIGGLMQLTVQYLRDPAFFLGRGYPQELFVLSASYAGTILAVFLFHAIPHWGNWRVVVKMAGGPVFVVIAGYLASWSWMILVRSHVAQHYYIGIMFLPLTLSVPLALFASSPKRADESR